MSWARRGAELGGAAHTTAFQATLDIPVTQTYQFGDTVYAVFAGGTGSWLGCTDDAGGNTWTLDESLSQVGSAVFRCTLATALASGTNKVTGTSSGNSGGDKVGCLVGFSGVANAAHDVAATTASYESTGPGWTTGPTADTAEADALCLAVSVFGDTGVVSGVSATGYTLAGSYTGGVFPIYVYTKDGGASGSTESAAWAFGATAGVSVDSYLLVFAPGGAVSVFVPKILRYG